MSWLCAFAVVSVLACGSDSDTAPAGKPSSSAGDTGALPKIRSGGDSQAPADGNGAEIEVDLPEDLPIYPGAKIVEAKDGMGGGVSLTLETGDSVEDVAKQMSILLRKAGWYIQKSNRDDARVIFADKGSRSLSVIVERKGDVTRVSLLVLVLE